MDTTEIKDILENRINLNTNLLTQSLSKKNMKNYLLLKQHPELLNNKKLINKLIKKSDNISENTEDYKVAKIKKRMQSKLNMRND